MRDLPAVSRLSVPAASPGRQAAVSQPIRLATGSGKAVGGTYLRLWDFLSELLER